MVVVRAIAACSLPKRTLQLTFVVLNKRCSSASSAHNLYSCFPFAHADRIAFVNHKGEQTTYGSFHELVCRISAWLHTNQITFRDRVVSQLAKSQLAVALYLACVKIGAVYVPLSPAFRLHEVQHFIRDSKPKLVVVPAAKMDEYTGCLDRDMNANIMCDETIVAGIEQQKPNYFITPVHHDDVAAICYTSGTTGAPKGAMITHGNLTSNGSTLRSLWELSEADVLLHALPIDHIHGLFVSINSCLMSGSSIIFLPRFDMEQIVLWLPKATIVMGVPTFYTRLMDMGHCERKTLGHVRLLISGSAPLMTSTWHQFAEKTGQEILERYGMTEGQIICSNPVHGQRKPGTVGMPLAGVKLSIRQGILHYHGPNTFKGYWGQADKTRREFTDDGFFNSGDLAAQDSEGYVQILGRNSDMIITGGLNVYPNEVESVINSIDSIKESAVVGLPHRDFGEAVVAVVVPEAHACRRLKEPTIVAELSSRIAKYKIPKRILFVETLPRNLMGKVQKNVLREKLRNLFS
uniref:Malonyl-CoA synthase n=1 Tax=Trichuris muris TaxID=70415 RepID=A0A5S6R0H9_TRIMR